MPTLRCCREGKLAQSYETLGVTCAPYGGVYQGAPRPSMLVACFAEIVTVIVIAIGNATAAVTQ